MNRIAELIAQLCPDGVEFLEVDEICHINRGRVMSKEYLRDNAGQYPVYSSQTANEGIFGFINSYDYDFESITWTTDGANAGSVFYHCDEKFSITNVCGLLKVKDDSLVTTKFIYYVLGITTKQHVSSGMGNPKLMSNAMSKIRVPVPPLAVQREIVQVLDAFTALEAELEAELEARRRQYEYYRDRLLAFNGRDDIRWATLGEVAAEFGRGKSKHRPRNDPRLYGGDIPFIQTGDIRNAPHVITKYTQTYSEFGLAQSKLWPKGTLCITIAANIAETTILGFDSCFPDSVIGFIADPKKVNVHFVEYLLTSYKSRLQAQGRGSAQDNIGLATFENERLPFPPLEEQARIVAILDKFDALVNDLTSGLPAEINGRRQQYEHYRNRLLTFPEAER